MLHVKLFSVACPIPLPKWFREGSDGCLRKKSMLENFQSYIKTEILCEYVETCSYFKIHFSTSQQTFVTAVSFTFIKHSKDLTEEGIELFKAAKSLLEQDKIGTDVALLLDKVYLQKDSQYQDGKLVGVDNQENLYKGVMTFMINSLKKFIPLIAKAIPEIKIEQKWLPEHVDNYITSLNCV